VRMSTQFLVLLIMTVPQPVSWLNSVGYSYRQPHPGCIFSQLHPHTPDSAAHISLARTSQHANLIFF
jgi:hypothetical protein